MRGSGGIGGDESTILSNLARSREKCDVVSSHGVESNEDISRETGVIDHVEIITETGFKGRKR